ncbi:MAG TPA: sugar ABC transporter permease [Feifaniaceae bacterium]|nr:sugar ABC transporter permease [Feifaniaceae bacterium]
MKAELKQKKPAGRLMRKESLWAYLFISPFAIGLGIFYIYSFIQNIYFSFTDKKIFGEPHFIGLDNYIKLFSNSRFWSATGNTFLYVMICVPAVMILSIFLAVLLNSKIRLTGLYRTLIFIPAVTMPAAIGLVWRWMMNYEFGLFNAIFAKLGLEPVAWLSDPRFALLSVCIVLIWTDVSTRMVILLAGLQGIPAVYYEAAKIDGAGPVARFFRITLPLLSPTVFFCLLMETIGVFQIFDFIYLMIRANTSGALASRSLVVLFYNEAFVTTYQGYAAAITVVLFVIILAITIIQMATRRYWVHEE